MIIICLPPQLERQLPGSRDLVCLFPLPSGVPGRELAVSKYLVNKYTVVHLFKYKRNEAP